MTEVTDTREDELLHCYTNLSVISYRSKGLVKELTSAFATSCGDLIHSTCQPSFSMALTRDLMLPAA